MRRKQNIIVIVVIFSIQNGNFVVTFAVINGFGSLDNGVGFFGRVGFVVGVIFVESFYGSVGWSGRGKTMLSTTSSFWNDRFFFMIIGGSMHQFQLS